VGIGLPLKKRQHIVSFSPTPAAQQQKQVHWLMAVVRSITSPFVKAVQNYKGRGNR
jgi:hypothetical protein